MTPIEIDHLVAAVLKHVPKLREAGVLKLAGNGLAIELAPLPPREDVDPFPEPDSPPVDEKEPATIWNDPELYGLPEGAKVPRARRKEE